MSEESKDGQFNLDGILSELGSFGKYQLLLLLLLAFRDSFLAMCNFNYVFTAAEVDFRSVLEDEDLHQHFYISMIYITLCIYITATICVYIAYGPYWPS